MSSSPPALRSVRLGSPSRVLKSANGARNDTDRISDSDSDSESFGPRQTTPPAAFSSPHARSGHEGPGPGQRQSAAPARRATGAAATGGRYMPPALKRKLMADAAGQGNAEEARQRESWDQLKKRINGPVNKANTGNAQSIIVELFGANLVRGRGLLCRSLMRAQSQSTSFTAVYAALVAVINTKLPIIGELLVTRLVLQFRRAFKRDDKGLCISSVMFLAHLTNQRVAHEVLAFQIVSLLLETPTDDSVEVAVAFTREVGAFLGSIAPRVLSYVFDAFRSILHEAEIDKRTQYMIEVLFQYRRDGFKDSPVIPDALDLVEEDEQIVHEVAMDDDDLEAQDELNVFKFDPDFEENERKYAGVRQGILGEDGEESGEESGSESGAEGDSESEEDSESDEAEERQEGNTAEQPAAQKIHDLTETEMVNLRRTIYLATMSSISFEEAAHKLLKIEIRPGEEQELCNMVIECCSQERTYKNFYGLIGERLCKVNRQWANGFVQAFASCYENIHRYETSHLRNIAHFFAHQLASNALHWSVLKAVVLTEETTTSSSRIFIKILLQDMAENLGLKSLNDRLKSDDPRMTEAVRGMFPRDDAKSIRFAINYYTSIGLGAVTEEMREWLKTAPSVAAGHSSSGSDSDSDSSSSGSYSSSGSGSSSGSFTSSGSGSDSDSSSGSYSSRSSRSTSRSRSPSRSRKSRRSMSPEKAAHAAKDEYVPPPQTPKAASPDEKQKESDSRAKPRVRSPSYSPVERSPRPPAPVRAPSESSRSPRSDTRRRHSKSPQRAREPENAAKRMRDLQLGERSERRSEPHSRYEPYKRARRSNRSRSRSPVRSPSPRRRTDRAPKYDRDIYERGDRRSRHPARSRSPRSRSPRSRSRRR